MKDFEFIELLNLYLDHEISAADAARLEAEVQRNPARREIYRQYCQMQKACSQLATDFVSAGESRKVVPFAPVRHSSTSAAWWSAAGVAAAACVAVAVYLKRDNGIPAAPVPVATYIAPVIEPPQAPPASDVRAIARTVTTPMRRAELQPVLTSGAFSLMGQQGALALTPADFEWMRTVQLSPVAAPPSPEELLRFDTRPSMKPEAPVFRSQRPLQGKVEMTSFQFQK